MVNTLDHVIGQGLHTLKFHCYFQERIMFDFQHFNLQERVAEKLFLLICDKKGEIIVGSF